MDLLKTVQGFASNQAGYYRAEDIVTGTYLFESGVHGVGNWCFSAFEDVDVNEIVGSKGKITFSIFGNEPISFDDQLVEQSNGVSNRHSMFINPL